VLLLFGTSTKIASTQDKAGIFMDTRRIEIVYGDITKWQGDAIVNAANTSLLGGGGVDGAIHRAAGPKLAEECYRLHGCKVGQAKITGGYNLPVRYIIHTVGPVWNGGERGEDELLANCYRNSLALAEQNSVRTLAFPAISTGIFRFPVERAARIALTETLRFLAEHALPESVTFVYTPERIYEAYLEAQQAIDTHGPM
jgi:O-acetyl-ADP-ribose deacetylase (regulator of RNase III)